MKVLVTGGAGFIGNHIVDRLVAEGYKVRVVDNLSSGRFENIKSHVETGAVELMIGDLKDPQTVLKSVEGVDAVFHFAASPEVKVSTVSPEVHFRENVVATFNLIWDLINKLRRNPSELEILGAASLSV